MSELPETTLSLAQLKALASPARQRILGALIRLGPSSVAELADELSTVRSSLYYQIQKLVGVGLVDDLGSRAATTRRETVYRAVGGRMRIGSSEDPDYRRAVLALYGTHLDTIGRQLEASLERDPSGEEHRLLRYRVCLDDEGLQEFRGLLAQMDELIRRRGSSGRGRAHWIYLFQVPEE